MKRLYFISRKAKSRRSGLKKSYLFLCLAFILTLLPLALPFQPSKVKAAEVTVDDNVNSDPDFHNGASSTVVFTNDQTGYAFFADADTVAAGDGGCAYKKTTNGGTSWASFTQVDSQTDCFNITVWYDQWTPGDNSGTYIHIVTIDSGADDLWYTRLNTSDDSLSTTFSITTDVANTFNTGAGGSKPPITKGTDGDLYVGVHDDDVGGSYVKKCTTSCHDSALDDWTTNSPSSMNAAGGDQLGLYPLASAGIMAIRFDNATDDFEHKIYTDGAPGSWESSWTDIDIEAVNSAVYTNHWGAVVDKKTNDIYLAYAQQNDAPSYGNNDDDLRTRVYTSTTGWTLMGDVLANSNKGITGTKIAFNSNNADVYVVYSAMTTPGTLNTGNVYYKKSTNGMTSWGSESSALNTDDNDLYGARVDILSNERIYVTWVHTGNDDLLGNTVADLVAPTYDQSAYTLFTNTDSRNVGSRLNYQDTPATLVSDGDAFRLRLLLHVNGDGIRRGFEDFKLQFATRSVSCDTGYSGETYADVTSSSSIAFKNNTTPADGQDLINNDYDPIHSGHTVVSQTYEEANNFTNGINAGVITGGPIGSGEDGKWDFALLDNDGATNGTYCFRVVKADNSAINTPIVVPEVTTVTVLTCNPLTEHLMRHGNYYCNDAEDKFKWAEG